MPHCSTPPSPSPTIAPGNNGMTAKLEISYRRPTPLYQPITVRAKQLRHEGRKRFTVGEIVVDGEISAAAEGLFIARRS